MGGITPLRLIVVVITRCHVDPLEQKTTFLLMVLLQQKTDLILSTACEITGFRD